MAEGFAAKCVADHSMDKDLQPSMFDSIIRNFYVLSELDFGKQVNYSAVMNVWFGESSGYNYRASICTGLSCQNYTQVCSIRAMERGCCITGVHQELIILIVLLTCIYRWCRQALISLAVVRFTVNNLWVLLVSLEDC